MSVLVVCVIGYALICAAVLPCGWFAACWAQREWHRRRAVSHPAMRSAVCEENLAIVRAREMLMQEDSES